MGVCAAVALRASDAVVVVPKLGSRLSWVPFWSTARRPKKKFSTGVQIDRDSFSLVEFNALIVAHRPQLGGIAAPNLRGCDPARGVDREQVGSAALSDARAVGNGGNAPRCAVFFHLNASY
jgi:hypothetical protein